MTVFDNPASVGRPDLGGVFVGGRGDDLLAGTDFNDRIKGGAGDDTIEGGGGGDSINAGDGADLIVWTSGDGSDAVDGGAGADTQIITLRNGAGSLFALQANAAAPDHAILAVDNNIAFDMDHVEVIKLTGTDGSDAIRIGDLSSTDVRVVEIDLAGGNGVADGSADAITLREAGDSTTVTLGDDGSTLQVATEVDGVVSSTLVLNRDAGDTVRIELGDGADFIDLGAVHADANITVDGGNGAEFVIGSGGADTIDGDAGNDIIQGNGGADLIQGGDGDDLLSGSFDAETFTGGAGDDLIQGFGGADMINGGDGDDMLSDDFGGAQFVFLSSQTGEDTIFNFHAHSTGSGDTIVLKGYTDQSFEALVANGHLMQSGINVLVTDGAHTIVTLLDTSLSGLTAADFLFT